jgi:hypothetical protein
MDLADRINAALQLDQLDLPPKPRVVRLEWEPHESWTGEDSLKIWIIIADDTTDDELTGGAGLAVRSKIWDSLQRHKIDLFGYTSIVKESEYETVIKGT